MFEDLIKAVILGLVEGATEFIPVSSTGHLIVFNKIIDFQGQRADTFDVFIQLGAILAVVLIYRERFSGLFDFKSKEVGFRGLNGWILLAVACLPIFILGFIARDFIKEQLFATYIVAIGFLVGGVAILLVERFLPPVKTEGLDNITWKEALAIGIYQCLALWPGVSRSASTILGGMATGVERKTAAEFSFFVAVPALIVATGYDMLKSLKFLTFGDIPIFAVGFIVSFFTALFVVKFFIQLLGKNNLIPFGWYRIGAAIVVLLFIR